MPEIARQLENFRLFGVDFPIKPVQKVLVSGIYGSMSLSRLQLDSSASWIT